MERHKTLSEYQAPAAGMRVGGELEARCTRCKTVTTHVILALESGRPARVMCRACKSQHRYSDPQAVRAPARRSSGTWAEDTGARPRKPWAEAIAGRDLSRPVAYSPGRRFAVGEVMLHGRFGLGVVLGEKEGSKIVVVFEDDTRVLVHDRGGAA